MNRPKLWGSFLALTLLGCGAPGQQLHFTYHGFTDLQVMALRCAGDLIADQLHDVGGEVWLKNDFPSGVYGHTTGPDAYLMIDLAPVPALPQIFTHELVHILEGQQEGIRDAGHTNPVYFGPQSLEEDLSYQAFTLCQRPQ